MQAFKITVRITSVLLSSFLLFVFVLMFVKPGIAQVEGGQQPEAEIFFYTGMNEEDIPEKTVLLLFPYEQNMPAYVLARDSIVATFEAVEDMQFDLHFEYLELSRFPEENARQQMMDLLTARYRNKQVDLVIVASLAALDLWLEERSEILPDTPVVFYDVATRSVSNREFPGDVFGVISSEDYEDSVRWILEIRPQVNKIVIVHGVGAVDDFYRAPVERIKRVLAGKVIFEDWSELSLPEIKTRAAELPDSAVILYHLLFVDIEGNHYHPLEALRQIAEASSVPVISGYDHFIGTGTIGGYVYSVEQQAADAVDIGVRILRGEDMGDFEVLTDQGNRFIFDHEALQRYDISLADLPPDSIVKNRVYSVWDLYRSELIAVTIVFLSLLMLVVYLINLSRQLHQARLSLMEMNIGLENQVQERTAELLDKEAHYRSIFESARDAILIEDFSGNILDANPAACEMYGFENREMKKMNIRELVAPEDIEFFQERRKYLEIWLGYPFEALHMGADGQHISVEVSCQKYKLAGEERMVCTIRDISQRKEAESSLRNAQRLLSLGSLAGGIAHEVNSPLQIITGMSERLIGDLQQSPNLDSEIVVEGLERIRRNGWRIAELMRALLVYAYPAIGQSTEHDLNSSVHEALDILEETLQQKSNVDVELDLAEDLPLLLCNAEGITQVVFQLAKNGLGAMPDKGLLTIGTQYEKKRRQLVLQVSDTGEGIHEEIKERMFDPFFTTRSVDQGAGLGLSIVQGIVQAHNGDIQVDSQLSKGTTITVSFPLFGASPAVHPPEQLGRFDPDEV